MREITVRFNNNKQYVVFFIDDNFYTKYGSKQYAYYECVGNDDDEYYANIYLPTGLTEAELAGTVAHEVTRLVCDRMQTQIATMSGEIVTEFMEQYGKPR